MNNIQLKFNDKQLLIPAENIPCDWEIFFQTFVTEPNMEKRSKIYHFYEHYMEDLKTILGQVPFVHWINGSFVTGKRNPCDIDVITFLSSDDYQRFEGKLSKFMKPHVALEYGGYIDAYILPNEMAHLNIWKDQFTKVKGKDKKPLIGQRKGFIEITS